MSFSLNALNIKTWVFRKRSGCQVQWWSPQTIKQYYPLYESEPFVGGIFGPERILEKQPLSENGII